MLSKTHDTVWLRLLSCSLMLFVLTACSAGQGSSSPSPISQPPAAHKPTPMPSPTTGITGPTTPGLKNCQPASPMNNVPGGAEVQGTATHAELWALIQSTTGVPPQANSLVKIVWRMTGSGSFTIVALGPHGMKVPPSQGPIAHLGSDWQRPGQEWGSGFTFPVAGCWDLHATRGTSSGDVWLVVQ